MEALLRDHGYRRPLPATVTPRLEVVFDHMLGSITVEILRGVADVAGERDCTVGDASSDGHGCRDDRRR